MIRYLYKNPFGLWYYHVSEVILLRKILADKTMREYFRYYDSTFPAVPTTDDYSRFIDRTVNCHWHNDFEFGLMLSGTVDYYINNTCVKLQEGDCFFVSANMLHMGKQTAGCENAVMFTFRFPASLLADNIDDTVYRKFFRPIMDTQVEGFTIASDNPLGADIRTLLMKLYGLEPSAFFYELECIHHTALLWIAALRYMEENIHTCLWRAGNMQNSGRMKEILSYIHHNYSQKITAADIAAHLNISVSECFRCFKRFMNKGLVRYTNEYRLQKAAKLLRETGTSITDVYTACGFESASYFGKVFKGQYGATPLQYRRQALGPKDAG